MKPLIIDAAAFERSDYCLDASGLRLGAEQELVLASPKPVRGWIRRLAPDGWREDASPRSHDGVVRASWYLLLAAVIRGLGVEWLTGLDRLADAENKALQHLVAAQLGITMPKTVVVSRRELIPAELGEPIVAKPLGPGSFASESRMQVIYANELSRTDSALDALGGAPFLLQERLVAELHLRVVTVGDQAWICELNATALPLDWRRVDQAHDSFRPSERFAPVAAEALRLAASFGVGYSSQDWLVAGDTPYFVDLNPGGQWLFLPAEVADGITSAIADWMVSR